MDSIVNIYFVESEPMESRGLISFIFFIYFKNELIKHIYIFSVLGLHCCMWAFSDGRLSVCGARAATAVASLIAEHGLPQLWHAGSVVVAWA